MTPSSDPQRTPARSRELRLGAARWWERALRHTRVTGRHGDEGVSLVEVLIASIILLVTMLPMGILLTTVSSASADARQRQAALQLADSWVEILANSQPPTGTDGSVLTNTPQTPVAPAGTQAPSSTLGGTVFTVTAAYAENLVNSVGQSDLCTAGQPPSPSHPGVIQLRVTVTWNGGLHTLSDTTEINYPKPGLQTEGFLAINLTNDGQTDVYGNQATDRLQALPVTITQISGTPVLTPNPYTLYSDANGCIFAQVPVGVYNIAIGQPTDGTPPAFSGYTGTPPFVTPSGSTTDAQNNQQVQVTAEATVQLNAFDEGITGNVTYGGASAVGGGVSCPNAATMPCIALGDGTSGASAAWGDAGGVWSSTALAAGTSLNQVACTTGSSAYCAGVGYGPGGGFIVTTSSSVNSVVTDTVPAGVTDLTQVTCLSAKGCYALGTSSTGPVLLAGRVGAGGDRWVVVDHPGITFTGLSSLTCPTSATCELSYAGVFGAPGVLRLDGDPGTQGSSGSWSPTITSDTLPAAVRSVGTIACPTSTTCLATAVGDQASSTDATVITMGVAGSGASAWSAESTFPTGASSVTGMSCSASTCVTIGTATGAPAVWTGNMSGATHGWVQANGIPSSVASVTSVACGNPAAGDSADCAITAVTSAASASGQLLVGSQTNGSWAWNFANLPASDTVQYFVGVSCERPASAANATCAAVGSTAGGPVILSTGTGPSGTWSDVTPPSLPGSTVTGIPLETSPSGTVSWTTQIAAGQTPNASTLPNVLYPQANGYSIVAGDCASEASSTAIANLNAAPGGTASATVPLGLLNLQLIGSTGAPVSGATVTITSMTCPGSDAYNLPVTDATGATMTSVPYGSYSYTVTQGSTAVAHTAVTLQVGANSVQVQTTSGGPWATVYLPGLVPVAA
ncbi:MAG TPA: hypothetical protein VII96_00840 [Acidimicrobiales bacterium]